MIQFTAVRISIPSTKPFFKVFILFFLFSFLPLTVSHSSPEADSRVVVQPHERVIKTGIDKPSWMRLWESAREEAAQGKNKQALRLYRELFSRKANIEEALREYLLILMNLEMWQEARTVHTKLQGFDQESLEYQLYGGRIALHLKQYQQASTYFGQVYTMSPSGSWALEALKGQITSLQELNRVDLAYPLMEQLYLLEPDNEDLLRSLANYSLFLENNEKGIGYFKTLLTRFDGIDKDFLASEPLFVKAGDTDMAVRCWTGYLKSHPFYIPFHTKLSKYYLSGKDEQKALPHLLVRVAHGEKQPEIFLQIGNLYLYHEGRPDKALYYYDEYLKGNPGDLKILSEVKRIQAVLANDLLGIVENEGAWQLWRDLARVIPDRLAVYYSMAEQLEPLGKEDELLEVLEIINFHNPGDPNVLLRLARLYFQRGDLSACEERLDSLPQENQTGKDYFYLRAVVEERKDAPLKALEFYRKYLEQNPGDKAAVLYCLQLSGKLHSMENIEYFYGLIPGQYEDISQFHKGSLLYGRFLESSFLFTTARSFYNQLLTTGQLSAEDSLKVQKAIARTLQGEKNYFAAEQHLRQILLQESEDIQVVEELIGNALLERNWQNAWKWYETLDRSGQVEWFELFMWKIRILEHSGQTSVAMEMAEDLYLQKESPCPEPGHQCIRLKTKLAELYYLNEEFEEARLLLHALAGDTVQSMQMDVLSQHVEAKHETGLQGTEYPKRDDEFAAVLERAILHERYGDPAYALALIQGYLQENPTSVRALVLRAEFLVATGNEFAAVATLKELMEAYPDEKSFHDKTRELNFKIASFDELQQDLAPGWNAPIPKGDLILQRVIPDEVKTLSTANKLLLARTLWAVRRWDDSLLLYNSLLHSPVDREFSKRLENAQVSLTLPPPQKSFWNVITFTTPAEPDRLSVVMSPEFTRENLTEDSVAIATDLYAKYRWQQLVSQELSVRRAMYNGHYYQAMKEYQKFLDGDPSTESLYDLAGIYSRLGFFGKEASIYEIIKNKSPGYPDLDEAIQRNSLKRKPWVSLLYDDSKKTGREGYLDNKQKEGGLQSWYMPSLRHVLRVNLNRLFNESMMVDQELWRSRMAADIEWSPLYDLDFLFSVGGDWGDDDYASTFLYNLQANGRIGDMVQGYVGLSQDVVDDTVEALMAGVNRKEYEAGLSLDFLPRLFGGGEYRFTEYSDGNHQNRYELWASYILNSEPKLLQLRYGYEYSHNASGNIGRDYTTETGFDSGDHPYWSPNEYWQHLFTVSFEHQLAEDVFGRSAPSYYSVEYSFGYEAGGYDNHQFGAQIFLEMSRHFLLNSSFDFIHGSEYEEQGFSVSFIYRM